VKEGPGTTILAFVNTSASGGSNSFLGNVSVNAGTLQLGNAAGSQFINALGSATDAARTITIASGAILDFQGRDASPGAATYVVNGGTIRNTSGFNMLGPIQLNAGTISTLLGNSATFQALAFNGDVTIGGAAASTISTTGTNATFT